MRIQLKQHEIEAAIRAALTAQGISIVGKSVEMTFTSGRKNKGLSADVLIEDQVAAVPQVAEAAVVTQVDQTPVAAPVAEPAPAVIMAPPGDPAAVTAGDETPEPAGEGEKKSVGSLFG